MFAFEATYSYHTWHRISRCLSAVLGTAQGMVPMPVAPAQAMPVQPVATAMVTMQVIVPPNTAPGQQFVVDVNGQQMAVVVPLGAQPGAPMTIQVPAGGSGMVQPMVQAQAVPMQQPAGGIVQGIAL